MRKRIFFAITVALLFILLIGCSKDDEKKETSEEDVEQSKLEQAGVYPLTGKKGTEGVDRRIVSVMVNNHPDARPQSGLSKADIVFEILAEGDVTRFLALFQSEQPDVVGPVRSAREYYFNLAKRYDALYVYHGAADFIDDMVKNGEIDYLNGATYDNDGHLFKRESFRKAPHNSYLQFGTIEDVAREKGYETTYTYEPLPFMDEGDSIEGDPAARVEIMYPGRNASSLVEFTFDEQSGQYTRSEAQQPTVELETDEPIEVENVFLVEAYHEVIDDEGRRSINLNDGGNAYLIQQGKVQKIAWENKDGRIVPIKDGQTVGFVKGKTWINVVPSNPGIEQSVTVQ